MNFVSARLPLTAAVVSILAGVAAADVSFWDLNVFSRSTIGASNQGYGSDFQGASAAVGNAYFNGFTVRAGSAFPTSLPGGFYGGGNFTLSGSVNEGGIYVAGNVTMNNASINGPVHAGGNLGGNGGSINGNVSLGGIKTAGNQLTVNGALQTGQAYQAPLDLASASAYFAALSSSAASHAPTAAYSNNYGELIINASGPATYVNLSQADFTSAWGITVKGSGAVVVNVAGSSVSVGYKTWNYQNGASSNSTLLNFGQATSLTLSGGAVNVLAPLANTTFSSGLVTGNLIVNSLMGSGQVNWNGGFTSFGQVPTPGSVALLLSAGLFACVRRTR